jgi:germination protein YpeB
MVDTYYETDGGICTVNFAGIENGVTDYTDLIKVGVALDNGEIMSLDARGFITAHYDRKAQSPAITPEKATEALSSYLTVQNTKTAIIPSMGENERFCYEFLCLSERGTQVLVYVNADTGLEEKIMLLKISDKGTLVV